MTPSHLSVLLDEVVRALVPEPWDQEKESLWLDGTLGLGGHATAILMEAGPKSRLLGLDKDAQARAEAGLRLAKFRERVQIVPAGFEHMAVAGTPFLKGGEGFDGILMDLGVSSLQLDDGGRGFSFSKDAPLDMRMDQGSGLTAAKWLETQDEFSLKKVLKNFGEEPRAGAMARSILRAMPVTTTKQLADAILRASGPRKQGASHPATRSFQAIRIAVNGELDALDAALPQAVKLLKRGGRLAVISFHSLEDRKVKEFIVRQSTDCLCPVDFPVCRCGHKASLAKVLRKAVQASDAEVERNPRARSARLRVAEKL